jgi:hypothetical protein
MIDRQTIIPAQVELVLADSGGHPVASELDRLIQRVKVNLKAMSEASANVLAHAMAIGDNLITARKTLIPERRWGKWLKEEFEISRGHAHNYCQLARHRALIEANVQRVGQSGGHLTLRGALRLIAPPRPTSPSRPKMLCEVETPSVLGKFLEQHGELFFEALAYAPTLRAVITKRLERPLGRKAAKARKEADKEVPPAPLVARGDAASIH